MKFRLKVVIYIIYYSALTVALNSNHVKRQSSFSGNIPSNPDFERTDTENESEKVPIVPFSSSMRDDSNVRRTFSDDSFESDETTTTNPLNRPFYTRRPMRPGLRHRPTNQARNNDRISFPFDSGASDINNGGVWGGFREGSTSAWKPVTQPVEGITSPIPSENIVKDAIVSDTLTENTEGSINKQDVAIDFSQLPPFIWVDGKETINESTFYFDKDSFHNFTCIKNTTRPNVTLIWKLQGSIISGVRSYRALQSPQIYSFLQGNFSQSGLLTCIVAQKSVLSTGVHLIVKEPPIIKVSNSSFIVGQNLSLTCQVPNNPYPHVEWKGPHSKRILSTTLVFAPLNASDSGHYTCISRDSFNETTEQEYEIILTAAEIHYEKSHVGPIVGGVLACLLFLLALVLLMLYFFKRYKKEKSQQIISAISYPFQPPSTIEKENEIYDDNVIYDLPPINDETSLQLYEEIPLDKDLSIPDDYMKIDDLIGEGSFGQVYRAIAANINGHSTPSIVAIKMLKENPTEDDRVAFMTEVNMCKTIPAHENIITFHGSFYKNGLMGIIYDYAACGTLKDMLMKSRNEKQQRFLVTYDNKIRLTSRNLMNFAYQIACAMRLLSGNEFIHNELAARNILLDENLVCKITHLSSARSITQPLINETKTLAVIPVRWLALESLTYNLYTIKSDVWSFGVLLWEIITLGAVPYYNIETGPEVKQNIEKGYRMQRPLHCSEDLFNIVSSCWESDPRSRPTFDDIVFKLEHLLRTDIDHIILEIYEARLYEGIAKNIFRENWE